MNSSQHGNRTQLCSYDSSNFAEHSPRRLAWISPNFAHGRIENTSNGPDSIYSLSSRSGVPVSGVPLGMLSRAVRAIV